MSICNSTRASTERLPRLPRSACLACDCETAKTNVRTLAHTHSSLPLAITQYSTRIQVSETPTQAIVVEEKPIAETVETHRWVTALAALFGSVPCQLLCYTHTQQHNSVVWCKLLRLFIDSSIISVHKQSTLVC